VAQIFAALILAAGAFYGVYKGAVYAVDRLAAQLREERSLAEERLDAEERRVQMQLDAEAARLDRQLAHDRRMRDLIELRAMLDEVATATGTAIDLVAKARGAKQVSDALKETAIAGPLERDAKDAFDSALPGVQALLHQLQRLRFRFGDAHPVTRKFVEMRESLMAALLDPDKSEEATDTGLEKAGREYIEFVNLCRPFIGVEEVSVAPGDSA
jgi:hypothetical protein